MGVVDRTMSDREKIKRELELLALDCEETAIDDVVGKSPGERRAWLSVTARVRHIISLLDAND